MAAEQLTALPLLSEKSNQRDLAQFLESTESFKTCSARVGLLNGFQRTYVPRRYFNLTASHPQSSYFAPRRPPRAFRSSTCTEMKETFDRNTAGTSSTRSKSSQSVSRPVKLSTSRKFSAPQFRVLQENSNPENWKIDNRQRGTERKVTGHLVALPNSGGNPSDTPSPASQSCNTASEKREISFPWANDRAGNIPTSSAKLQTLVGRTKPRETERNHVPAMTTRDWTDVTNLSRGGAPADKDLRSPFSSPLYSYVKNEVGVSFHTSSSSSLTLGQVNSQDAGKGNYQAYHQLHKKPSLLTTTFSSTAVKPPANRDDVQERRTISRSVSTDKLSQLTKESGSQTSSSRQSLFSLRSSLSAQRGLDSCKSSPIVRDTEDEDPLTEEELAEDDHMMGLSGFNRSTRKKKGKGKENPEDTLSSSTSPPLSRAATSPKTSFDLFGRKSLDFSTFGTAESAKSVKSLFGRGKPKGKATHSPSIDSPQSRQKAALGNLSFSIDSRETPPPAAIRSLHHREVQVPEKKSDTPGFTSAMASFDIKSEKRILRPGTAPMQSSQYSPQPKAKAASRPLCALERQDYPPRRPATAFPAANMQPQSPKVSMVREDLSTHNRERTISDTPVKPASISSEEKSQYKRHRVQTKPRPTTALSKEEKECRDRRHEGTCASASFQRIKPLASKSPARPASILQQDPSDMVKTWRATQPPMPPPSTNLPTIPPRHPRRAPGSPLFACLVPPPTMPSMQADRMNQESQTSITSTTVTSPLLSCTRPVPLSPLNALAHSNIPKGTEGPVEGHDGQAREKATISKKYVFEEVREGAYETGSTATNQPANQLYELNSVEGSDQKSGDLLSSKSRRSSEGYEVSTSFDSAAMWLVDEPPKVQDFPQDEGGEVEGRDGSATLKSRWSLDSGSKITSTPSHERTSRGSPIVHLENHGVRIEQKGGEGSSEAIKFVLDWTVKVDGAWQRNTSTEGSLGIDYSFQGSTTLSERDIEIILEANERAGKARSVTSRASTASRTTSMTSLLVTPTSSSSPESLSLTQAVIHPIDQTLLNRPSDRRAMQSYEASGSLSAGERSKSRRESSRTTTPKLSLKPLLLRSESVSPCIETFDSEYSGSHKSFKEVKSTSSLRMQHSYPESKLSSGTSTPLAYFPSPYSRDREEAWLSLYPSYNLDQENRSRSNAGRLKRWGSTSFMCDNFDNLDGGLETMSSG